MKTDGVSIECPFHGDVIPTGDFCPECGFRIRRRFWPPEGIFGEDGNEISQVYVEREKGEPVKRPQLEV